LLVHSLAAFSGSFLVKVGYHMKTMKIQLF
jgi:hypothetical protein